MRSVTEASEVWMSAATPPEPPRTRPRQRWPEKFRVAFRGIKLGVRGHSSFAVHFFMTALVVAVGVALECRHVWQWCVLLGCIGMVLTAELFNSAIETLFRGLDEAAREKSWPALDIAAGAVLLASIFAGVLIGALVLGHQLLVLVGVLPAS